MPFVRVTLYEGRSTEKKRQIAEAITEALVTIGGTTSLENGPGPSRPVRQGVEAGHGSLWSARL